MDTNDADPHQLQRFLEAQERAWGTARRELEAGRKRSHWMWFVFPQVQGLGRSPTARRYAIRTWEEAKAYRVHEVLGARLVEATELALAHGQDPPEVIFGGVDAMKFRSCMTLFEAVAGDACFTQALRVFFRGDRCAKTLEWLEAHDG